MFCPKCSQERKSTSTVYCTGCGFRLTEVAGILNEDTAVSTSVNDELASQMSPRKRGLRQSFFIFLSTFLVFTVGGLLQAFFGINTRYFVIFSLISIFLGFFRGVYALAFESGKVNQSRELPSAEPQSKGSDLSTDNLETPAFLYASSGSETPASVIDSTTRELVHRNIKKQV